MKPAKQVLDKIIWDAREKPEEYSIGYHDRVMDEIIEIAFTDIKRFEEGFMVLERNGEETMIPMHRIRTIRKNHEVIWQRQTGKNQG